VSERFLVWLSGPNDPNVSEVGGLPGWWEVPMACTATSSTEAIKTALGWAVIENMTVTRITATRLPAVSYDADSALFLSAAELTRPAAVSGEREVGSRRGGWFGRPSRGSRR